MDGSGYLTAAAATVSGSGYSTVYSVEGRVQTHSAVVSGWGSEPVYSEIAAVRSSGAKLAGVGNVVLYSGDQVGVGVVTAASATVHGMGSWTLDGVVPPPDPVPDIKVWPPPGHPVVADKGSHSFIGNIAISVGGVNYTPYAEQLRWDSNVSGGYGNCTFSLRTPCPVPSFDQLVIISGSFGEYWRGKIVNTPEVVFFGEFLKYEVVAEGPSKDQGRSQDFAWTGSDSDVSGSWEQIDCQNWNCPAASEGFQISADTSNGLRFQSADLPEVGVPANYFTPYESALVYYDTPSGNNHPDTIPFSPSHCPQPDILWSAFYYQAGSGLTKEPVTGITAKVRFNLETPLINALPFSNLDAGTRLEIPDRAPDWSYGVYPPMNYWIDFYHIEPPCSLWAGLYVCDEPWELPVQNPVAMWEHEKLIYRIPDRANPTKRSTSAAVYQKMDPVTHVVIDPIANPEAYANGEYMFDEDGFPVMRSLAEALSIDLSFSGKLLVFYSTFYVVQHPFTPGYGWDSDPGPDEVRTEPPTWRNWYAVNELFSEGKQFVELVDVKVTANEQSSGKGDLSAAIRAASGGGLIDQLTVAEGADIKIEPYSTRLAAIEQLVGMSAETVYWGWDPEFFCVKDRGLVTFDPAEPGITVNASIKNEGVIATATVIYSESSNPTEDRRVLAAWVPKSTTFDVNGDGVSEMPILPSGMLDRSALVHSSAAAAEAAQSAIIQRGISGDGPQWEGSISLRGVGRAAAIKVATRVNCGSVENAVITSISVDVDSDTITLSLGGAGYVGRFPSITGVGNSAAPVNALRTSPLIYQARR